ncbi:MAG: serine/threonine-protein kinase PknK [Polyangiales bacterium]
MPAAARDGEFGERFQIVRSLGEGGMGVVYEAFDRTLGTHVALKTVRVPDPATLYRFKQEFRTLVDVTHKNLIALHELHSFRDRLFFTMELVEGIDLMRHVRHGVESAFAPTVSPERGSLATPVSGTTAIANAPPTSGNFPIIRDVGSFDETRLRAAFTQLCEGVAALHGAGKLHRDIKPSNVLVRRDGRVVLLDFGLVAEIDDEEGGRGLRRTFDNQFAGTAEYMSPEQATSAPLSEASDWYSVGVVLYEALTGELPIVGERYALLMDKQRVDPTPPSSRVADVPADLDALCVALLSRDPERRPGLRETLDALSGARALQPIRARRHDSRGMRALTSGSILSPFLGRQAQLAQLQRAFDAACAGQTQRVFVQGESGLGKSMLVRRFTDSLAQRGAAVVLSGRCYENESVPFEAVDDLIDALGAHLSTLSRDDLAAVLPRDLAALSRLFPVLRRIEAVNSLPRRVADALDPQEIRRRGFVALRDLFTRIGDRKPLVLWIDDLHWADADGAALLAELLRPPDSPPLLFLATFRSEDVGAATPLRGLLADRHFESQVVEVGPLSSSEAIELAMALLGVGQGSESPRAHEALVQLAATIADESQGNPFFIDELVRHAQSGVGLRRSSGGGAPVRLDDAIVDRVDLLEDDARKVLELVAIAGRPVLREATVRAAELGPDRARTSIAVLRTAHLIRAGGTRGRETLVTYHDRVRRAVASSLDGDTRRQRHARLAIALDASTDASPEALVLHFEAAGEIDRAADAAVAAGERAVAAYAFDQAASWFAHAITLRPALDKTPLARSLGDALANAGRGAEAAAAYLRAAPHCNAADALEMRRRAAEQLLRSGHIDDGLASIRDVLGTVGLTLPATRLRTLLWVLWLQLVLAVRGYAFRPRDPTQVAAAALTRIDVCWSINAGLGVVDTLLAQVFQKRQLIEALAAGEPARVARALAMETVSASIGGSRSKAKADRVIAATAAVAATLDDPYVRGLQQMSVGIASFLQGRWRAALESLEDAESLFRLHCVGVVWELATTQWFTCLAIFQLGDLKELARRVPVLTAEAEARGDLYLMTNLALGYINQVWLAADRPDVAEREIDEGMARWPRDAVHLQHYHELVARTNIDLYRGDGEKALARIEARWTPLSRAFVMQPQRVYLDALHIRARARVASARTLSTKRATLLGRALRDARTIERSGEEWALPFAPLIRASVASLRRDRSRAAMLLRVAILGLDRMDMPLWATAARHRLGALLELDPSTRVEGEALLSQAERALAAHDVCDPARFACALVPGIAE